MNWLDIFAWHSYLQYIRRKSQAPSPKEAFFPFVHSCRRNTDNCRRQSRYIFDTLCCHQDTSSQKVQLGAAAVFSHRRGQGLPPYCGRVTRRLNTWWRCTFSIGFWKEYTIAIFLCVFRFVLAPVAKNICSSYGLLKKHHDFGIFLNLCLRLRQRIYIPLFTFKMNTWRRSTCLCVLGCV